MDTLVKLVRGNMTGPALTIRYLRTVDVRTAALLADAMQHNCTLKSVTLNGTLPIELLRNSTKNDIDLSRQGLRDADVLLLSALLVRFDTTAKVLNLAGNDIGDEGAAALADFLVVNTSITAIILLGNKVQDYWLRTLDALTQMNKGTATLALSNTKLDADSVLAKLTNSSLTSLDLQYNLVSAKSLQEALASKSFLRHIDVRYNYARVMEGRSIAKAVMSNETLETFSGIPVMRLKQQDPGMTMLDLARTGCGVCEAYVISALLAHNTTVTSVSLKENRIAFEGAVALAEGIINTQSLIHLNVHGNSIGDTGVAEIAEALKLNTTLLHLCLRNNNITDLGAAQVARGLVQNRCLTTLDLGFNHITTAAHFVELSPALRTLNLRNNNVSDAGLTSVAAALKLSTCMTSLDLTNNHIGAEGAIQLAECFKVNQTLRGLHLRNNIIDDSGIAALCAGLKVNASICELDLAYNTVTAKGAEAVMDCLQENTSILDLEIHTNIELPAETLSNIRECVARNQLYDAFLRAASPAMGTRSALHTFFFQSNLFDPNCVFEIFSMMAPLRVKGMGSQKFGLHLASLWRDKANQALERLVHTFDDDEDVPNSLPS